MDPMEIGGKALPEFIELVCQLESRGLLSCALSAQNVGVFLPVAVKKLRKFLY